MNCSTCGAVMGTDIEITNSGTRLVPSCAWCKKQDAPPKLPPQPPQPKEWQVPPRVISAAAVLRRAGMIEEADMFVRWARGNDPRGGMCNSCGKRNGHETYCPLGKILDRTFPVTIELPTEEELAILRASAAEPVDFDL